ncbi:hypothetical protein DXG01_015291 [Tephrocybe rancida]|nr:hypothetical protein DXG01_015291 [Tephrocybe rancida]
MLLKTLPLIYVSAILALVSDGAIAVSANQKVGIAWANSDVSGLHNFKTANNGTLLRSLYSWGPTFPSNAKSLGFKPVPMLWGTSQIASFQSLVVEGYADTVLGFNEYDRPSGDPMISRLTNMISRRPNEAGQSSLSAAAAASLWLQYIQPLKSKGYKLISPAVSNAPSGITWLKDFFTFCGGCTVDSVALHWFGTSSSSMTSYISQFHNTFGKPIWVTEFAYEDFSGGTPTQAVVNTFMAQVVTFMEASSYVETYFAFGS